MDTQDKINALAAYLHEDADDLSSTTYDDDIIETPDGAEYRVLTDIEADDAARDYVADSLWAFNSEFLAEETDLPVEVFEVLQEKCEGANDALTSIVSKLAEDGVTGFAERATQTDGRGHFLSTYDGGEIELGDDLYAYRVN